MASEKNNLSSWPQYVLCDPMVLRRDDKHGMHLFCFVYEETYTRQNKNTRMRHQFTVQKSKDQKENYVQHQEA